MNDDASRLRFLRTLEALDEPARAHLLRIETEGELAQLFDLAMRNRMTGVAASIEVEADGLNQP